MGVSVLDPDDVFRIKAAFVGCLPDAITCHPYTVDGDRKLGRVFVRFFWVPHRRAVGPKTTLLETSFHPRGELWIARLQVHPDMRRRGLGRALTHSAERFARSLSCRSVKLFPSFAARSFWWRLGYEKDPVISRVLSKRLDATTGNKS